jgi:hypothetical protein
MANSVDPTNLPEAVVGYIEASNAFNLDELAEWFAEDSLVNDARREFWGKRAIRTWLGREVVGDKVTMDVFEVIEHNGSFVVRAFMNGEFDKTNLPDELVLTHYFKLADGRISELMIIRNEPTPQWAA